MAEVDGQVQGHGRPQAPTHVKDQAVAQARQHGDGGKQRAEWRDLHPGQRRYLKTGMKGSASSSSSSSFLIISGTPAILAAKPRMDVIPLSPPEITGKTIHRIRGHVPVQSGSPYSRAGIASLDVKQGDFAKTRASRYIPLL